MKKTGPPTLLVTQQSACRIGFADNFHQELPLETDHSGLVKVENPQDENYLLVKHTLDQLVKTAPGVVSNRFTAQQGT